MIPNRDTLDLLVEYSTAMTFCTINETQNTHMLMLSA